MKLTVLVDEKKLEVVGHIGVMIALSICVVLGRFSWWAFVSSFRGPFGLLAIPVVCPVFCFFALGGLGGIIVSMGLISFSLYRTRSPIPAIAWVLGIFLAFQIPMPPQPDTPEKKHFLSYRADFERVVELARDGELEAGQSECLNAYLPPEELKHVSAEGCIYIWRLSDRGMTVEFNPLEPFYHPVVYIENASAKRPCGGDAVVEQKIDAHWYVCQVDWN